MPEPLEAELRRRHPAVRFVSERRLRRLLLDLRAAGQRIAVNPDLPVWMDRQTLLDRSALDGDLPDRVLLLTPPDDRCLFHIPEDQIRLVYERLILRAEAPTETPSWQSLTPAQRREVEFVLSSEFMLPESPTEAEVQAAFAAVEADLKRFQPDAWPFTFPLQVASPPHHTVHSEPVATVPRSRPEHRNFVRAALGGEPQALRSLCESLGVILGWSAATVDAWHAALQPLLAAARSATWPREKRALYDLQRIATDFAGPLETVAPVEWILSLGRQPLRRPLEPVRDAIILRRLRAAAKQIERSDLSMSDREPVEHLLNAEIDAADRRLRETIGPVILAAFDAEDFRPANLPERIARDKLVAELLDRLSATGFLRMADLRDAIARNQLKMPDTTTAAFLLGDKLLTIDRRLARNLHGVYHRGEIYLRGIQRFSGLAFGTPWGRWLTLFVALPFGGAFLAIEAVKHIAHAVTGLVHLIERTIEGVEAPAAVKEHAPVFTPETLTAVGVFGTLLLLLINVPVARRLILQGVSQLAVILQRLFISLPRDLWKSPVVRFLLDNRVTRFVSVYVLWPCFFAIMTMLLMTVVYPTLNYVLQVGAAVFVTIAGLNLTRWGRTLREDASEYMHDVGRRVFSDILPGLVSGVLWFFREVLNLVERGLYAVDEWFRYRPGQSKPSLVLKVVLALAWFPIAYVVRFGFYLLLEPQVNPIKHFPVVTVSHKVLLPLIGTVADIFNISKGTAGLIITGIPGIFGFLVWEFKENWRLYTANRPVNLPRTPLGHHGESVRGLLRPGFHSGTIPKLYRRFRKLLARPAPDPAARDHLIHELHHLDAAVRRLVDRELLAYWRTVPALAAARIDGIVIGVQRIEVALALSGTPLRFSFEHSGGAIVGTLDDRGFLATLGEPPRRLAEASLGGLFASAAVTEAAVAWRDWLRLWSEVEK